MTNSDEWSVPELDPDDEALVRAYKRVGVVVDDLPHTPEITELVKFLGKDDSDPPKHDAFKRLLRLRKQGRLPRINVAHTE